MPAFHASSRAQNGTFIADGGQGAVIDFADDSTGDKARIILDGNGNLDLSLHNAPGVTVGSVEGSGLVFLGSHQLTVGSSPRNVLFNGIIQDGGEGGGTGGRSSRSGAACSP